MMKRLLLCLCLLAATTVAASERNVTLKRDFGTLHGSLMTPDADTQTVALIIAGSGPTDRNANNHRGMGTNSYLYLAQALCQQGIASLRYDKRGVGASTYDDPSPENYAAVVFEDFVNDAAAWVDFLAAEGYKRIVLIGHSEGALISLVVAQQKPAVSAVVSASGAGFSLDEVLQLQLAAQLLPSRMDLLMEANAILASLKQGKAVSSCPEELAGLFNASVQQMWITNLRYDPRTQIRAVQQPVLIIQGNNDLQVPADNAEALFKAQPRAQKIIIEGMTHSLKKSEGRDHIGQIGAYSDSTLPLDADFTAAVVAFIHKIQ